VLFPTVVDHDAGRRLDRLRAIFLVGTRLSLATVMPVGGALILMADPLVHAWVGPEFAGSVPIVQLLALSVIVRVGNATAMTVLKGAGRHRLVAFATLATAAANISLSIAIIRPFGLPGVALGTLVPVTLTACLVIFPAGCRRVQVPLTRALAEAAWPALWPAAVMAAYVGMTRGMLGASLPGVAAEMIAAVAVYAVVFVAFGLRAEERRRYVARLFAFRAQPRVPAAVSEGA
jgi:O-antigen/teichoic acid export membrane protein